MREALKEAQKAFEKDEIPVGCVIVLNQKIIARAHNQTELLHDVTAHAEMLAITSASHYLGSKYLEECVLYVTLEPCLMCAGAIHWAQVGKLVYGASDEKKGYSRYTDSVFLKKMPVVSGILKEEAASLLKTFFQQKRQDKC